MALLIFRRFKAFLFLFGLLILAGSCSPQKRAQRHLRRALALDPSIRVTDTVKVEVPGRSIKTETILSRREVKTIEKDGMELTLELIRCTDSVAYVYVNCETKTDTVYRTIERFKEPDPVKKKDAESTVLRWFLYVMGAAVVLIIVNNKTKPGE